MNTKFKSLGIFNAAAFLIMIVVNALSVILPLNGIDPGQVSDSYPNLFAPAGITFSIWSVIYIWLFIFILYQLGVFGKKDGFNAVSRIGSLFVVSSLANAAWIFSWHYRVIPLSWALMVVILVSLILTNQRIRSSALTQKEKLFVAGPFSVYFGWITVATIANTVTLLVSMGWNRFGVSEAAWTAVALLAGTLIGVLVTLKNKDVLYGLVLIWAFAGILYKHVSPAMFNSSYPLVIGAAIAAIAIVLVAVIVAGVKRAKNK